MSVADKLAKNGPRKLLALDGGGIRGLVTIEVLAEIERLLREEAGDEALVLADSFDYIGGTSTGAIIAACLSLGMTVDKIRTFYLETPTRRGPSRTIQARSTTCPTAHSATSRSRSGASCARVRQRRRSSRLR